MRCLRLKLSGEADDVGLPAGNWHEQSTSAEPSKFSASTVREIARAASTLERFKPSTAPGLLRFGSWLVRKAVPQLQGQATAQLSIRFMPTAIPWLGFQLLADFSIGMRRRCA